MNKVEEFVAWLESEGFVEIYRNTLHKARFLGEADYHVGFKYEETHCWAHVYLFNRAKESTTECVLYPETLGARTVHTDLEMAQARWLVIKHLH